MKKLLVAALLAAFVAPASAGVNIVDGDTLKINGVTVRIVEIDTPETYKSRCEQELELGLKAKERLRQLLDSGPVRFEATGTDRYRRTLARVFVDDVNVGETLIKEGHALRYRAGGEAKLQRLRVWCGPDATLGLTSRRTRKAWSGPTNCGPHVHQATRDRPSVIVNPTWGSVRNSASSERLETECEN